MQLRTDEQQARVSHSRHDADLAIDAMMNWCLTRRLGHLDVAIMQLKLAVERLQILRAELQLQNGNTSSSLPPAKFFERHDDERD